MKNGSPLQSVLERTVQYSHICHCRVAPRFLKKPLVSSLAILTPRQRHTGRTHRWLHYRSSAIDRLASAMRAAKLLLLNDALTADWSVTFLSSTTWYSHLSFVIARDTASFIFILLLFSWIRIIMVKGLRRRKAWDASHGSSRFLVDGHMKSFIRCRRWRCSLNWMWQFLGKRWKVSEILSYDPVR